MEITEDVTTNIRESQIASATLGKMPLSNTRVVLKVPQSESQTSNFRSDQLNTYLSYKNYFKDDKNRKAEPNPAVLLKGFLPCKVSKEELEMTKRYLGVDQQIKTKQFKDSVIKGRRHTTDLSEQQRLKLNRELLANGMQIQIPTEQMRLSRFQTND